MRSLALPLVLALGLASSSSCGEAEIPQICTSNEDCFQDYVCDLADTQKCLRGCRTDDNCLASQRCDVPADQTDGVCRTDTAPAP